MTKTEIYNAIVPLIVDINDTGIAQELFEAAKSGDVMELVRVTSNFRKEHTMLYNKMYNLANKLNGIFDCEIFGLKEDMEKEIFEYNPEEINASSLFAFHYLTSFNEVGILFVASPDVVNVYYNALAKESGSNDFANFAAYAMFNDEELVILGSWGLVYSNKYELFVDVFAGKLKEYVEIRKTEFIETRKIE